MKKALLLLFLFLVLTPNTLAHHKKQVLGESIATTEVVFPPVAAGPGLILPDSPVYFLDKLYQLVKLAVTLSPEERVRVRARIAGERLAELRIMFSRGNTQGINTALEELTEEIGLSAKSLQDASSRGRNVERSAKEFNDVIKLQNQILKTLQDQTTGELRLRIKVTRESLRTAKLTAEDNLEKHELEAEIENDLEEQVLEEVGEAGGSAKRLENAILELKKQADEAKQKSLKRREEALKKAIDEKNSALKRTEENLLEVEKKKQEKLTAVQEKAVERARKAIDEAQKAAQETKTALEQVREIRKQSIQPEPRPTPTPKR